MDNAAAGSAYSRTAKRSFATSEQRQATWGFIGLGRMGKLNCVGFLLLSLRLVGCTASMSEIDHKVLTLALTDRLSNG